MPITTHPDPTMPIITRVAIFERNLLWHVAALGAGFAYSLSVVVTTEKVAFGPMCFLFILPLLAALRVCAAWMLDQAEAHRRTGVAWLTLWPISLALSVIDAAIQLHGGLGVCDDQPLARMFAGARTLRLADGPDEVHLETIAKMELRRAKL